MVKFSMRFFCIIIISLILLFCWQVPTVKAQDIIVIKSLDIQPYNETLEGFRMDCNSNIIEYTLSDNNTSDILNEIRARKSALILTVGLRALDLVKNIHDVPIVYSMVSNPRPLISGKTNITGVSMDISAKKQLSVFIDGIPNIKRMGIIYDPNRSAELFRGASDAASSLRITVKSQAVQDQREVPEAIKDMMDNKDIIDAFWMLPDSTVINSESLKYLFLASIKNKVPVLTFSEKYIAKGALMSLNIDATDIGRQACEMAKEILRGTQIEDIPQSSPRKARISVNLKLAEKMGLTIDREILQKSHNFRTY